MVEVLGGGKSDSLEVDANEGGEVQRECGEVVVDDVKHRNYLPWHVWCVPGFGNSKHVIEHFTISLEIHESSVSSLFSVHNSELSSFITWMSLQ